MNAFIYAKCIQWHTMRRNFPSIDYQIDSTQVFHCSPRILKSLNRHFRTNKPQNEIAFDFLSVRLFFICGFVFLSKAHRYTRTIFFILLFDVIFFIAVGISFFFPPSSLLSHCFNRCSSRCKCCVQVCYFLRIGTLFWHQSYFAIA